MVQLCSRCGAQKAALRRPKTFEQLCRECFYKVFEQEVHDTIIKYRLFKAGENVAIGASGGKDSTVLAHLLTLLNERHSYGLRLFLLSIDEGITGYRDDSLETVKRNEQQYKIPLEVVSYKQLYGWTMDEIVKEIGTKNNCTFCGVFRRQALDRGATMMKADKIATGHNADDIAETVLLNIVRGDLPRLSRCAAIITGEGGELPRVKPFKYTYQKEIVMYAYFKKLDYFSTECVYAPFAARGLARDFVKDLEAARPRAIVDLIRSAEDFRIDLGKEGGAVPQPRQCERCSYICSQAVCKACLLLEGLNKGLPSMGISRPRQVNNRAAAKSAAAAVRQQGSCDCQQSGGAADCQSVEGLQSQHDINTESNQVKHGECCGANGCGREDQLASRLAKVATMADTVDHLVQQDEDSQTQSAQLLRKAEQSGLACSQITGADIVGSHDSVLDGVMEHGQSRLRSGRPTSAEALQSSGARTNGDAVLSGRVRSEDSMMKPVHVVGKQYESNLREVEAHPSARHRKLRAEFDASW